MFARSLIAMSTTALLWAGSAQAADFKLEMRYIRELEPESGQLERRIRVDTWKASETAVIVCDCWDLHHCLNAVRRLEEFAPRLNEVLTEARQRGATIIHSPSDCMPAYADHPARKRALAAPPATKRPRDIEHWCSRIPAEERAVYPIDQSDGGEDDDPQEHAHWAAKLKSLGRNPGTPWKSQSGLIDIDAERDFISDRGDEVWNILQQRGIQNVILTGVHTNMCVLGRPFGLRQMVRNGMQVVLMRDMTDCMYNPKRWPYVEHFTGNDLVIAHVERFVCPTITSDQVLGGKPFRWKADQRAVADVMVLKSDTAPDAAMFEKNWSLVTLPATWSAATRGIYEGSPGPAWYRCAVRVPQAWSSAEGLKLTLPQAGPATRAWWNGHALELAGKDQGTAVALVPVDWLTLDDANLLVIVHQQRGESPDLPAAPKLSGKGKELSLQGRWQFRLGDDPAWSNIPLPARFGASPDILFEPAISESP